MLSTSSDSSCPTKQRKKKTLLGFGSDSDVEEHEYQDVRNCLFSTARIYKAFLYLTSTSSLLAILILLPKHNALRGNHARLEKELAMLGEHVHIERSAYG